MKIHFNDPLNAVVTRGVFRKRQALVYRDSRYPSWWKFLVTGGRVPFDLDYDLDRAARRTFEDEPTPEKLRGPDPWRRV